MGTLGTILADQCQLAVWSPCAAGSPCLAWALDDGDGALGCRVGDKPGMPGACRGMRKLLVPPEERWECSACRRRVRRLFLRPLPAPGAPLPARSPLALLHPGIPPPPHGRESRLYRVGGTEPEPTLLHGRGGAEPRRLRVSVPCPAGAAPTPAAAGAGGRGEGRRG